MRKREFPIRTSSKRKKVPHILIIHGNVQVRGRDADIGMSGRVPNLRERPAAGERMADERVAPVNRQHFQAFRSQDPAGRPKSLAERVTG